MPNLNDHKTLQLLILLWTQLKHVMLLYVLGLGKQEEMAEY